MRRCLSLLRRTANKHVKLTVERRRRSIPFVLRTPAAAYVPRWALGGSKSIRGVRVARGGSAKSIAFGLVTRAASNGARPGRSPSWRRTFPVHANPAHAHDGRSVGDSGMGSGVVASVHG